ncbi:hypothetical protein [Bathymodiolus platifrons methanotrophic gill symbiont]|uniref:hypothetical protein n=1 Tax=Bathymodiolus platifrons methanotrophic gill symbiont TaxID=113268 RepID=UPI001124DE72|nr:hypothetical protein [Bathymodiolus platifrons methanotrophic gill symbiont]
MRIFNIEYHFFFNPSLKVLLCFFLFSVSPLYAQENFNLEIVNVDPRQFNPLVHEQAKIQFKSERDGQAFVRIYDRRAYQVREIFIEHMTANEVVLAAWNGRDDQGRLVANEAYFFTIEATDIRGNIVEYSPVQSTLNRSIPMNVNYDTDNKKLSFSVEQDGIVDIRYGAADGGPLLSKLIEWKPFLRGQYSIDWDGWDASGVVSVNSIPGHHFYSQLVALPEYSLFTFGNPDDDQIYSLAYPGDSLKLIDSTRLTDRLYSQANVFPYKNLSPIFDFSFNTVIEKNEDIPIVSDKFGITIRLNESVKQRVTESRYEILVFVDFKFVTEIEEGRSPARMNINTSALASGEHILTVNVVTLQGGLETLSKRFVIK